MLVTSIFSFSHNVFCPIIERKHFIYFSYRSPFPKQQILHSSRLKEFADDNFRFDEKGREFLKRVGNTVGKVENFSIPAITPFPTVFSKYMYLRHIKTGLVWERVNLSYADVFNLVYNCFIW